MVTEYPVFIYAIFDDKSGIYLYVGASVSPKSRFASHKSTRFSKYPNKDFLKLDILEECEEIYAGRSEEYWYWQIRSWGFDLKQTTKDWYRTPQTNRKLFYKNRPYLNLNDFLKYHGKKPVSQKKVREDYEMQKQHRITHAALYGLSEEHI